MRIWRIIFGVSKQQQSVPLAMIIPIVEFQVSNMYNRLLPKIKAFQRILFQQVVRKQRTKVIEDHDISKYSTFENTGYLILKCEK